MEELELHSGAEEPFSLVTSITSMLEIANFLFENNIGIFVVLHHVKAKDWPRKGQELDSDNNIIIPLVWAVFDAMDSESIRMRWDVHPAKCFPQRYNQYNPNSKKFIMPIIKREGATLAGCSRNFVTISSRKYEVYEKTPKYCSIFGLPDDCYDPEFEKRLLQTLKSYASRGLWCFERTQYINENIEPLISLRFMKGEFLPSLHFIYSDTPEHFLKGIYKGRDLEHLSSESWYSSGWELIEDLNLENRDRCFRFEEVANENIRKGLIRQFIKLLLLLMHQESFSAFVSAGPPALNLKKEKEVSNSLKAIIAKVEKEIEAYVDTVIQGLRENGVLRHLGNTRFMVMDVEYMHVSYPTKSRESAFNFPCIFSSLIWRGAREGFKTNINVFTLPCHFCGGGCKIFNRKSLNFSCLSAAFAFIERQASMIEELLQKYEGFKIYTYGRSDVLQFEQAANFFTDSFEIARYERRNRKKARRIVEISEDLSIPGVKLSEVEDEVLKKWLPGWSRKDKKVEVNPRFMKRYNSPDWESDYYTAINSSVCDTTSAFLYLLHQQCGVGGKTIRL